MTHHGSSILTQTSLENGDARQLLWKAAEEDRCHKYIWNISNNALLWVDPDAFRNFLRRDFGEYYLYLATKGGTSRGIFGMLNLSERPGCANLLIWVDKSVRNGISLMSWFVLFLQEAQEKNVTRWYANVRCANKLSLESSFRFGFDPCRLTNQDPGNQIHGIEAVCVSRSTNYNAFEQKYLSRRNIAQRSMYESMPPCASSEFESLAGDQIKAVD
jgi:hypothetical protein